MVKVYVIYDRDYEKILGVTYNQELAEKIIKQYKIQCDRPSDDWWPNWFVFEILTEVPEDTTDIGYNV